MQQVRERLHGAMATRRIPDPKIGGSIPSEVIPLLTGIASYGQIIRCVPFDFDFFRCFSERNGKIANPSFDLWTLLSEF